MRALPVRAPQSSRTDSSHKLHLRIRVLHPPAGVAFAIQVGKSELLPPELSDADALTFDFIVRLDSRRGAQPRFLGPAVQGPPIARFIYVNSGTRAGQSTSCWDRRAKVPLHRITWQTIDRARDNPKCRVEARIFGTARDGGPACATVPLLGDGWEVISA
jgi:hypothetical protein